jgi:predicted transcriptional regulator
MDLTLLVYTKDKNIIDVDNLLLGVFSNSDKVEEAKKRYIELKNVNEELIISINNIEQMIENKESTKLHILEEQNHVNGILMSKFIMISDNRDKLIKYMNENYTFTNETTYSLVISVVTIDELVIIPNISYIYL